jgi:DNA-binding CsgD family transcriptional regulator
MSMIDPIENAASRTGDAKHDCPEVMGHVLAAINMLNLGILVVDREARIIFANHFARDLLQSPSEASAPNQPSANARQSAGALDRRLRQAISGREHAADSYLALPASGDKSLIALVVPCRNDTSGETNSILFVSNPTADLDVDLRPIARLYGLTGAEIRLLDALLKGQRAGAYAKLAGVTLNTVKGHLNQLFRKTQTSRQSELVLRVLANPAFRVVSARPALYRAQGEEAKS